MSSMSLVNGIRARAGRLFSMNAVRLASCVIPFPLINQRDGCTPSSARTAIRPLQPATSGGLLLVFDDGCAAPPPRWQIPQKIGLCSGHTQPGVQCCKCGSASVQVVHPYCARLWLQHRCTPEYQRPDVPPVPASITACSQFSVNLCYRAKQRRQHRFV